MNELLSSLTFQPLDTRLEDDSRIGTIEGSQGLSKSAKMKCDCGSGCTSCRLLEYRAERLRVNEGRTGLAVVEEGISNIPSSTVPTFQALSATGYAAPLSAVTL